MRIFTCNSFRGHWPVPTAAVVIAEDVNEAAELLEAELAKQGLKQDISTGEIVEISIAGKAVHVLSDGEY